MYKAICDLLQSGEFSVVESFNVPGQPAQYESIPDVLFESQVGDYLEKWARGLGQPGLWRHQAQAIKVLGQGDNVVVSTGTASGKSLVFRAIALHKVLRDPSSRVVVFYPLRALVADQLIGWREMIRGLGLDENVVGQIDGSVPSEERGHIIENAKIIMMTPDVCQAWLMHRMAMPMVKNFVRSLSTIVMDEAHTLEGVFGSNFAFLIRRMIAARNHLLSGVERPQPLQFIAATATISNPREHMKMLTGAEFTSIDHEAEGAPRYERVVAHIKSPEGEELKVAKELQQSVLTNGSDGAFITFVDSRKGVETLAMVTQQSVDDLSDDPLVAAYKSGYTPASRRAIEEKLRSGERRGVVSTSALELGIDFSNLSVGFNVNVPPTRKAYRQRLGRIGRNGPGAFIVIGPRNAFTRYGTSFRDYHDMSVEPSYLYLDNRFMQFAHGRCLSDEREALSAPSSLPTRVDWPCGFEDAYKAGRPGGSRPIEFDNIAELGGDAPHWNYPLRNVGEVSYPIKLHENTEAIGGVNQTQALRECYPGAVYLHEMKAYEVAAWRTGAAAPFIQLRRGIPGRSTRPRITTFINAGITTTELIDGHLRRSDYGFLAECNMLITERVDGYFDAKGEFLSYQELQQRNPNMKTRMRNFRTTGIVLCIKRDWFKNTTVKRTVSDRLREVFTHEYSVSPQDVGSASSNITVRDADGEVWRGGCIAIFDETYGSLRLTERLYLDFDHLIERLSTALQLENEDDDIVSKVHLIREEVSGFSSAIPSILKGNDVHHRGYEMVFTQGSRVCYREQGSIATDVEIIQPTIMNGVLMYQVKAITPPGQSTVLRWVPASGVEPSADADAWEYAWWNRETQTYENPPDDTEE